MSFRETILNEALVIFEHKGIENISLETLLDDLEISRGTLLGIAGTKKELVQHCIQHSIKERQAALNQVLATTEHPLEALLQMLQLTLEEVYSLNHDFVQDLRDHYPLSWVRLHLYMRTLSEEYLKPLLQQSIALGYLQADLLPELVVRMFLSQMQGLTNPALFPANRFGYQELFKVVVVYYLRGCATPLGQEQIEEYTCRALAQ
ncbi:TetR/AcrR family transcriptional regulator [Rufibacter sp. LB8]|uniref:TetR/AcrR family transcriptional regulator n=1 Tax=Rufibacter sp. LB8 TaxID=2777781 RepID=UPI00178C5C45|nr:TetR/AcrR family transcriptional regulator [Rufibacter sp. LB8]